MSDPVVQVVILAAIALFVLFRLYSVLGKGEDDTPMRRTEPSAKSGASDRPTAPVSNMPNQSETPIFTGPAAAGLEEIYAADNSFSLPVFLRGARSAYEMIVNAYGRGDRETLRPLLDDDVYEAWDAAITNREAEARDPFELLRIKKVEIESAELDGNMARIWVHYQAELGDGETTRTAKELWAYMRDVTGSDPNWILDDVEEAN